jgi:hypothetical protein
MNAEELRIGNWVKLPKDKVGDELEAPITAIGIKIQSEEDCYEPIPITEEWLEKFGFVLDEGEWHIPPFEVCIKYHEITGFRFCLHNEVDGTLTFVRKVKYIHQLQNLYYALTGKEL